MAELKYGDRVEFDDPVDGKLQGFYRGPSSTTGKVKVKTQTGAMYHVPVAKVKALNGFENGAARARVEIENKLKANNIQYPKLPQEGGEKWSKQETKERAERFLKKNNFPSYSAFLQSMKAKYPGVYIDETQTRQAWTERDK